MYSHTVRQPATLVISLLLCLSLTACGFHLKETTALPSSLQKISLQGIGIKRNFGRVLRDTFTDARSDLQADNSHPTKLTISNLEEGRRVKVSRNTRPKLRLMPMP